jgi:hypothetical protein
MSTSKPKSPATVRRALRQIRCLIDTSPDVVERKIAYEIECALRWATEPGIRGWPPPVTMAREGARLLRWELRRQEIRFCADDLAAELTTHRGPR